MTESTKTMDAPDVRRTTPGPFAALSCIVSHTFRVVLKGKEPIAVECKHCFKTWPTGPVELPATDHA